MNQNTLERIFRNGSDGSRRFSPVKNTGERFSSFCKDIIEGNKDFERVHLHIGLGIPKDGNIPKRLAAILIPALEIMKGLLGAGIEPPRLVIYQATTAISAINNINPELSSCISDYMENRLRVFILMNFSELSPYISFCFGERKNDMDIVQGIAKYVDENIAMLQDKKNSTHFEASGKKHGNGSVNHFYYIVANNYYNGGYSEYPFTNLGDPEVIIPIGGRSETDFFKVLLETQQSCRDIFPLITQVGAFPTYYVNPRGDVQDDQDMSDYTSGKLILHLDIAKDLSVLSPYKHF